MAAAAADSAHSKGWLGLLLYCQDVLIYWSSTVSWAHPPMVGLVTLMLNAILEGYLLALFDCMAVQLHCLCVFLGCTNF